MFYKDINLTCEDSKEFFLNDINNDFDKLKKEVLNPHNDNQDQQKEEVIKIALNASQLFYEGYYEKNIIKIQKSLNLFPDLHYVSEIHDTLQNNNVYGIFVQMCDFDVLQQFFDDNEIIIIDKAVIMEYVIQKVMEIIYQITIYSPMAITEIIKNNFIPVFLNNVMDYSNISKRIGYLILSNIILLIQNIDFLDLIQIIDLISFESDDKILQRPLLHLLSTISYRISLLKPNKFFENLSKEILSTIFEKNDFFNFSYSHESRKEIYYTIYKLSQAYPSISFQFIFQKKENLSPFLKLFNSDKSEFVEYSLRLIVRLFQIAKGIRCKILIMKLIPWEKLLKRIADCNLDWPSYFFQAICEMSICPETVLELGNIGVFDNLINNSFPLERKIEICQMFINILDKASPDICLLFVKNGVLKVFFSLLDLDSNIAENILQCLHIINEKISSISSIDIVIQEYNEYDAISIMQDLPKFQEMGYLLCKELGLIPNQ